MYYGLILNIKQNHGFKPWDGVKKKKKNGGYGNHCHKIKLVWPIPA